MSASVRSGVYRAAGILTTLALLSACGGGGGGSSSSTAAGPASTATQPAQPTQPTQPTQPAQPTQPTQPTQPALTRIANVGGSAWLGAARPATPPSITIGPGPVLGTIGSQTFHEDFQDWDHFSLKGLDNLDDSRIDVDRLEASRDIVGVYIHEDTDRFVFRVDLVDLEYGAETNNLDIVVLFDWFPGGRTDLPHGITDTTACPWDMQLTVFDTQSFEAVNAGNNVMLSDLIYPSDWLGSYFRADLDAVEFGIKKEVLRRSGWTGLPLKFQVFTVKDGATRIADAHLEVDALDRVLDQQIDPAWTAGRAHFSPVVVANRAILKAPLFNEMVADPNRVSSRGTVAGFHRTLDTHAIFDRPLNVHMSGAFLAGLNWASTSDPGTDGPAFVQRLRGFFDGNPLNGEGAFIPGSFADQILPFFENRIGQGANGAMMRQTAALTTRLLGHGPTQMVWTPEMVIRGRTFIDLLEDDQGRDTGHSATVLDMLTHLREWYGEAELTSNRAYKINAINGVRVFFHDPGLTAWQFQPRDGGLHPELRRLFHVKASQADQEQAVVTVADWEQASGNKNPETADAYNDSLRWIANHPWIEVATLEDLAGRGWSEIDRGTDLSLPTTSNDWLHHATVGNYDNWYYGHSLEESFAGLRPEVRPGLPHARILGDVGTRGTLLGDAWFEATTAPAGNLAELSRMVFAAGLYRTAWHSEDMHNLSRNPLGEYIEPDTTRDTIIGFAYGLQTHVGDAAVVARAARWSASTTLTATATAVMEDVDLDGEDEAILFNDKLFAVFEPTGGRVKALFARDPMTGEGYLVSGSLLAFTGGRKPVDHEGDTNASTDRDSLLKDWWLSNPGTNQYVNDHYVAQVSSSTMGFRFTSSDGAVVKEVELDGDSLEVEYQLDPSAGNLYLRGSVSPFTAALVTEGQAAMTESDDGQVLSFTTTRGATTVAVDLDYASPGYSASLNSQASDGHASGPRTRAFSRMVELYGSGTFRFAIRARVR